MAAYCSFGLFLLRKRGGPAALLFPLFLLAGLLSACAPTTPPRPAYRIVFSQNSTDSPWRRAMVVGMQRELSFHPEIKFRMMDAGGSSQRQQQQIRALSPQDADLLIVSPNETEPLTAAVEETYERGLPVLLLDRRVNSRRYTAFVGGSNLEVGRTAARYAAGLLGQRGAVVEILGTPGSSAATDRHQGFAAGLAAHPGLRLVGQVPGKWNATSFQPDLTRLLKAHPEVDLIFAHNDPMALGAYQVCRQLGRTRRIRIIGVDGLPGPQGGIELVRDQVLAASILYLPGGEEAIRVALRILSKQPYERENTLGTTVIDSTNVLMMRQQTDRLAAQQQDIRRQQGLMSALQATYASEHQLLYGLLGALLAVAGFGAVAWRASRQQRHLNRQLTLRNAENARINEQLTARNREISSQRNQLEVLAAQAQTNTEAKLRFFTNFSHELRTPLTLILGPVEELLSAKASLTAGQRHDLGLVRRNTQRLLQLVNQLLDFRKMEVGKMRVRATEGNLVSFVGEIVDVFERPARLRGIELRWLPAVPVLRVWFDANILDKVLLNLLSNALKFTPAPGRITLRLLPADADGRTVRFTVEDTGPGISEADQAHIFEWFYQGRASGAAASGLSPGAGTGSGMGLALALGLVRLHHGELTVRSQPGRGSTFELTLPRELPAELRAPAPDAAGPDADAEPYLLALPPPTPHPRPADLADLADLVEPGDSGDEAVSETLVLVIEDNPEVNDFLVRKLRPHYQVRAAPDGISGLQLAADLIPDLIVCDVMMPGLSGLELVTQLRADWRTSHVPVILLTARHAPEQQVEGVQAGADLYLTKPFNPAFLLESVRTLLANRARQRAHFHRELSLNMATVAPTRGDQQFLADLRAIVEANLSRSELSVDDVARSLGLSRVQLYRKVKAVLGTGVSDFIQSLRLTKARQLLRDENLTIAEVGYETGFSTPSYFSTSFRARYQISPSEFRALHTPPA